MNRKRRPSLIMLLLLAVVPLVSLALQAKTVSAAVKNMPTVQKCVMNTTQTIQAGDSFAIAYYDNTKGAHRLLYCAGSTTDAWGVTATNNAFTIPAQLTNKEVLWTVEDAGNGNWYLKSEYTQATYYLNLSTATSNKVNTATATADTLKVKIEAAGNNQFKISSADASGQKLGYNASTGQCMASSTEALFYIFKLEDVALTLADYNSPKGTTTDQPYIMDVTANSRNFRIPCMVTLSDGRIVSAADIRWNHDKDGRAIDLIVSYSDDNGKTWNYNAPLYFNDSIDPPVDSAYANYNYAATIMDPVILADKNDKLYLLADLFPGGVAIEAAVPMSPQASTGYESVDGTDRLVLYNTAAQNSQTADNYTHYVGDFQNGFAPVYDRNSQQITHYIDETFYLYDADQDPTYCYQIESADAAVQQNIFFYNADLHVRCATYLVLLTSEDGGETWSKPALINHQVNKTNKDQFYGVGPGTGLALEDGTLIFPMYSHNGNANNERSSLIYSTDGGVTWTRSGDAANERCSESVPIMLTEDRIRLFIRSGGTGKWTTHELGYVDYIRNGNGAWETDRTVTRISSATIKTNNQLSALRFSKTVEGGKPVIVVSSPSASSNDDVRADGRIYTFKVNDDATYSMELINALDVYPAGSTLNGVTYADGKECYTYSSITEQSNGTIGLLVETDFGPARMTYRNLSFGEVFGSITFDPDTEVTGNQDKVYDGTAVAFTTADVNTQGRTGAVTFAYYTKDTCDSSSKLDAAPSAAGTYWVKAMVAGSALTPSNTSAAKQFTISPAPLTITSATAANKTADGSTTASVTAVSFSGLKNGDTLTLNTDFTASGAFENAAAGASKKVTVTVALKATDKAKNYILNAGTYTTTATITQSSSSSSSSSSGGDSSGDSSTPSSAASSTQSTGGTQGTGSTRRNNTAASTSPQQESQAKTGSDTQPARLKENASADYVNSIIVQDTRKKQYKLISEKVKEESFAQLKELLASGGEEYAQYQEITEWDNSLVLEIHLKDLDNNQKVQPSGEISFLVEYPTGSNRSHTFIIIHVEGESAPVLLQEGIDYEKTADGLLFTVDSFSPFIIAWEDGTEAPADTPADAAAPSKEATPEKQSEVIKVALPGYVHILLIILPMIGAVVGAFFGAYVGIYYYTRRKENGK